MASWLLDRNPRKHLGQQEGTGRIAGSDVGLRVFGVVCLALASERLQETHPPLGILACPNSSPNNISLPTACESRSLNRGL